MNKMIVPFSIKNMDKTDDFFTFKGLASTFGNTDLGMDRMIKGAFTETIKNRTFPILWQHNTDMPLGVFSSLKETDEGLEVEGKMPKDDTFVSGRVMPQMKVGSVSKMSVGFSTEESKEVKDIREITRVSLWEVSLVTFPMNEKAEITEMKKIGIKDLDISDREFEKLLKAGSSFSNEMAKRIVSALKTSGLRDADPVGRDGVVWEDFIKEINKIKGE